MIHGDKSGRLDEPNRELDVEINMLWSSIRMISVTIGASSGLVEITSQMTTVSISSLILLTFGLPLYIKLVRKLMLNIKKMIAKTESRMLP